VVNNVADPIGYPQSKEEQKELGVYEKYTKRPEQNKGDATYWNTIADLSHREYHFKSVFAASQVWVSLDQIDFDAKQPVREIQHLGDYAQKGWEGNILSRAEPVKS